MEHEAEKLLRAVRLEPGSEFVRDLEHRLLADRKRKAGLPTLFAGLALGMGLTLVIVALAVAGVLPMGLGRDQEASAKEDCRTIMVERTQRRPEIVTGRDGQLEIVYRRTVVRRPMTRCN